MDESEKNLSIKKYQKIVILDSVIFYSEHRERLNKIAKEIIEYNTCKSEDEVIKRTEGSDCIISCWVNIPNKVIEKNSQLKTIAFWTHAYEHRIDKVFAKKHNIYVSHIPDYGTDSVAELVFIGLLHLYSQFRQTEKNKKWAEEIMRNIGNEIRKFNKNWKDTLRGSWIHEYIKIGRLKLNKPEDIPEDTLKGLTVGVLVDDSLKENFLKDLLLFFKIAALGFKMNVIYSLNDLPYGLHYTYRPIERLLKESQILIYDSKHISQNIMSKINENDYLAKIDISKIKITGESLIGKKLGIIGLGRIGGRVAQIAKEGFDMNVSYFSKFRRKNLEKMYNLHFVSLENLLKENDIISFHLPHIGAEKFITNRMINMIPPGKVVVNTSVGNIFESESYLLNRFKENDLKGYLDVYETLPPRKELKQRKNSLIATYRLGWRTKATVGLKTHKLISHL